MLALIAALALILYANTPPTVPRSDEIAFALERRLFPNNWDWFWHLVSYSRSRVIAPGDSLLFRPLHMVVLAVLDIAAPQNATVARLASIGMLTLAAFSLYLFVRQVAGEWAGFGAAVLFAVEYPGSVIVTYHHISPYLLGLAFFGFGLTGALKQQTVWSIVCLSIATLFHEMVPLGLLAALIYAAALARGQMRYVALVFGVPLLTFLVLNAIDAAFYGVSLAPSEVDAGRHYLYALSIPGGFLAAFLFPPLVRFGTMPGYDLPVWSNIPDALPTLYVLSVALLGAAIAAFLLIRRSPAALLIGATLAALIIGFGFGRGVMRGVDYVMVATWYNAMAIYLMLMLTACISSENVRFRMGPLVGLYALIITNTALHYVW